ncbi:MAG TPA: PadR family transcriptional regulator [Candidatus Eisenbacteria bacterium]|nr:PadR family transcriptional regulator [Candidatus Eisenbacteria bacterium]
MPVRGTTPYVILGLLRFGPLSGYEIRAELHRATSSFWTESYGQIYPALRALHGDGCVSLLAPGGALRGHRARRARGGRSKSVYAITAKGRKAFDVWLGIPPRAEPPRSELLMKLYLADRDFLEKPEAWLRELLEREQERLDHLERMQRDVPRIQHRHTNVRFWSFALAHGEAQARATIAWCRTVLASLTQIQQARDRRLAAAARRPPFE